MVCIAILLNCITSFFFSAIAFSFMNKLFYKCCKGNYIRFFIPITCLLMLCNILGNDVLHYIALFFYFLILTRFLYHSEHTNVYVCTFTFMTCLISLEAIFYVLSRVLVSNLHINDYIQYAFVLTVSVFFDFIIYRIFVKKFSQSIFSYKASYIEYMTFSIGFIFVIGLTAFVHHKDSLYEKIMAIFICVSVILFDIGFLFIVKKIAHEQRKSQSLAFENSRLYNEISCFEAQKECYEKQQKIIHDMQEHLNILHQLSEKEAYSRIAQYQQDIQEHIKEYIYYTKDNVLQILLVNLKKNCDKKGITLSCRIHDADLLDKMSEFDKVTIFANLFNNAYEAQLQSTSIQKYIDVTLQPMNAGLCIQVKNGYDFSLHKEQDRYYTTKENHESIGLKNVETIVTKHNGLVTIDDKNQVFNVILYVPLLPTKGTV